MTAEAIARRVALASMVAAAVLSAAKIYIGLMAHSTAVVSDGVESAADVLASGFVLFGLSLAAKPADEEHPYGHGRYETLTGLFVGILLVVTGAVISSRSFEHLYTPAHAPALYAIWPMFASIAVKSISLVFKRYYGRKIHSESLEADAWHDAVDMLSAVTALIAVSLSSLDPVRFGLADPLGGCIVGLIVIVLGTTVIRETADQLADKMPPPEQMAEIRKAALSVPGALDVEKCFARRTGLKYHVDLHLEVDPSMTVSESHGIATEVRIAVKRQIDWVADVLVHVEPHGN